MVFTRAGFELYSAAYHRESGTHWFGYDQDTTPPSMAVVAALSDVMDVDPLELGPLEATVDTDALDALVRVPDTTDGDVRIAFSIEGYAVTVHSHGAVAVAPSGHGRSDDRNEEVRHE